MGCLHLYKPKWSSIKRERFCVKTTLFAGQDAKTRHKNTHGIVGQLVLTCIEKGIALDDLTLDEYKAISPVFEQDIYDAISLKTCVEKRLTLGAPGPDVMKQVIEKYEEYLLND